MNVLAPLRIATTLPPICVVTAELPRMLGQIVRAVLAAEPDIEVVAAAGPEELPQLVGRLRVDVVIIGLDGEELPEAGRALFVEDPFVRLLGLVADGRQAFLYELQPHRSPLGEISPENLVRVIRERVGRPEASPTRKG